MKLSVEKRIIWRITEFNDPKTLPKRRARALRGLLQIKEFKLAVIYNRYCVYLNCEKLHSREPKTGQPRYIEVCASTTDAAAHYLRIAEPVGNETLEHELIPLAGMILGVDKLFDDDRQEKYLLKITAVFNTA